MLSTKDLVPLAYLNPKVEVKKETRNGAVIAQTPMASAAVYPFLNTIVEIPLGATVPTTLLTGGISEIQAILPSRSVPWINKPVLHFRVVNSSSVTFAQVQLWFSQIRVYQAGASDNIIQMYPIPSMIAANSRIKDAEKIKLREVGLSDRYPWTQLEQTPANSTTDFYLVLEGPWNSNPMYFDDWKDNLYIGLTPQAGGCLIAGTLANLTCTTSLIIESYQPTAGDFSKPKGMQVTRYLQPRQAIGPNVTLTAGTETLALNYAGIDGVCCKIQAGIWPAGTYNTNVGNAMFSPYGLGEDCGAQVEIRDESGRGFLGNGGAAAQLRYINDLFQEGHRATSFLSSKKFIDIKLCDSSTDAMMGTLRGFLPLPIANRYGLALTPGSAQVSQVQTISMSNSAGAATPTDGYFIVRYKDGFSESLLFNTSAANLAIAINAMPSVVKDGLTVTVNQALSAGTSATLTIVSKNAQYSVELFQIIASMVETGGTNLKAVTTLTTPGNLGGFVTGSYDVVSYAHMWREMRIQDGKVSLFNVQI